MGRRLVRTAAADPSLTPCVGDWVVLRELDGDRLEVVDRLPRRGTVVRASVTPGSSHRQTLAAHVDVVMVVEGLFPEPDVGRIERFLALAWESGARPLVVLTKADLVTDVDDLVVAVSAAAPAVDVVAVSVASGVGLGGLRATLRPGTTAVLLGPSGVGKSTLVNALMGADVMATQALRGDGKGRHTTVHRELFVLPGGAVLIDTPGLRSVGLTETSEGLGQAFADIEQLAARCRFTDCGHQSEPACAVQQAVQDGDLAERRLASYRKLARESAWMARRQDARLAAQERARCKQIYQEVRASGRTRP